MSPVRLVTLSFVSAVVFYDDINRLSQSKGFQVFLCG